METHPQLGPSASNPVEAGRADFGTCPVCGGKEHRNGQAEGKVSWRCYDCGSSRLGGPAAEEKKKHRPDVATDALALMRRALKPHVAGEPAAVAILRRSLEEDPVKFMEKMEAMRMKRKAERIPSEDVRNYRGAKNRLKKHGRDEETRKSDNCMALIDSIMDEYNARNA